MPMLAVQPVKSPPFARRGERERKGGEDPCTEEKRMGGRLEEPEKRKKRN